MDTDDEINIKHGYQVGGESLSYLVEQFPEGSTHDPVGASERSRDAFEQGDRSILALSQSWGQHAHAVMPIPRAESWNQSSRPWTIDVADPNRAANEAGGDQARRIRVYEDSRGCVELP
ncbi:hypothetical protein V2S66_13750 [Streptomyces sp. V4-01]|uniref:Uncharacterized protein n=1 Tax=Actinacidiphila polyblastidii TaxID=3110430 RepID=A0ABU7PCM2_9ACTN|nr:hypothetical protein [Streptomyces sp. V4-01]